MKHSDSTHHDKANAAQAAPHASDTISHPMQGKVDGSPRQRAQQDRLTQLQEAPAKSKPNGLPLPLRTGIETLSGMDMGDVVVHRNSAKPAQLNAFAYAQGNEIHLGPGQDRHLPHEAWHVVQQAQGRVKPTAQMKGNMQVNDDTRLEAEADVLGTHALKVGQLLKRDAGEVSPLAGVIRSAIASAETPLQLAKYTWIQEGRWVHDGGASSSTAAAPTKAGDFIGQIYDDDTGHYSAQPIRDYLDPWSVGDIQPEKETPLVPGQGYEGHTGPIQMPLEWVGDLAERMVQEWIVSIGITPHIEQNKSGHGLDMIFEITFGQLKAAPEALRQIFSSILSRPSGQSRYGRALTATAPPPPDSTRYVVIFEVKANSAQLSKAQRDPYKYVYTQSKTGFGLKIQEAIDQGCAEIFFEVRATIAEDAVQNVSFEFTRRDESSGHGAPKTDTSVDYQATQPFNYLNSKTLGDAGEQFARETLARHGYTSIGSLQKEGGQGVDIVAIDPAGMIVFFEVKTHAGTGKKAQLSKREKRQHSFVAEILFHIIERTGGYEEVSELIYHQALEVYTNAIGHDIQAREDRGEPPVGLGGINTDEVVRTYLAEHARYFIMDVDFPGLGQSGEPTYAVSPWEKKPKGDREKEK
jgi:Holliday junction resolvase-like predicted endonuclease